MPERVPAWRNADAWHTATCQQTSCLCAVARAYFFPRTSRRLFRGETMSNALAMSGTAPVVERIICLHHAPLAPDVFAEKLPAWGAA
jgi:hypothetical protein